MSNQTTYEKPQVFCKWLNAEGTVCASGGSGFENFTEDPAINW